MKKKAASKTQEAPKKRFYLGIRDELDTLREIGGRKKPIAKPQVVREKKVKPAKLISRLDHPVTLSYGETVIQIPPRGKVLIANLDKLGALPRGVSAIEQ